MNSAPPFRRSNLAGSAFLSYSRVESAALAIALQNGLERFAKPWFRLRAIDVFRDDTNMAANSDLRGTIEAALSRSQWFILLASPQAAGSRWVDSEIRWWLEHRSAETLMLVRAAGDIGWNASDSRFELGGESAVPPALASAYEHEPRWIDLEWFNGPSGRGAADPRFDERVADLAAPIHGRERADLVGENVRQHRRLARLSKLALVFLTGLLVLSIVATVIALRSRADAQVQRDQAVQQNVVSVSRLLAATAVNLTDTDMQRASLTAVEAYKLHKDAQTSAAVFSTAAASPHLVNFLDAGSEITATAGSSDASVVVAGTVSGEVWRWNRHTGSADVVLKLGREVSRVFSSANGLVVAAWAPTDAAAPSYTGRGAVWRNGVVSNSAHSIVALSPSGQSLAEATAGEASTQLTVRRSNDVDTTLSVDIQPDFVTLPSDNRLVVVDPAGPLHAYELPSGKQSLRGKATSGAHPAITAVDSTGGFVVVTNGDKAIEVDAVTDSSAEFPEPDVLGHGRTESPSPIAFAVSPQAQQLATAVDGRIFVSPVFRKGRDGTPPVTALTGSGAARAGTLQFLSQRILISGSGTAVSIWDLDQYSRLGPRLPVRHQISCNGCGPGTVSVSPSGQRSLIYNEGHTEVALADFTTGLTNFRSFEEGKLPQLIGVQTAWLHNDRLFTWNDRTAEVQVLTGATLGNQAVSWTTVDQQRPEEEDGPDQFALNSVDDMITLVDTDGRILQFDVAQKATVELPGLPVSKASYVGLDSTSRRAWFVTNNDGDETAASTSRIQIFDLSTGTSLIDRMLPGSFANADLRQDSVRLWGRDSALLNVDMKSGVSTPGPLDLKVGSTFSADQPFVVYEKDGLVSLFDTELNSVVGSFELPTEAYTWAEFGFAKGGRQLAVATAAADEQGTATVRAITFGYEQWLQVNCDTAGRDLSVDEWRGLTSLQVPSSLEC